MSEIGLIQEGRVWVFHEDNLNTEEMMPTKGQGEPPQDRVKNLFANHRPGWWQQVKPGDMIVAGRNFGTGHSGPVAHLLRLIGIHAVVAETINGLFFRNCVNYALPAMECRGVLKAVQEGDIIQLNIREGLLVNKRTGQSLPGTKMPPVLHDIILAGGTYVQLQRDGYF